MYKVIHVLYMSMFILHRSLYVYTAHTVIVVPSTHCVELSFLVV